MSRRDQFTYLEEIGLQVPRHGIISSVISRLLVDWSDDMTDLAAEKVIHLVVYTDERSHAGEGTQVGERTDKTEHEAKSNFWIDAFYIGEILPPLYILYFGEDLNHGS